MSDRKKKFIVLGIVAFLLIVLAVGIALVGSAERGETLAAAMKDAVLHEEKQISFFGLSVNPAVISAYTVTAIIFVICLVLRIFVIPRFKIVASGLQSVIEGIVEFFDGFAESNSPHRHGVMGVYIFTAGVYIFSSTLFELFGFQATAINGDTVALPAPLSDINAAIAMGVMSYLFIMCGGIASNGVRGLGRTLKEFSLPISMSFRLFGALLSGLLVTELVYYSIYLSFVVPVIVGVLFTLLHALVQTYVLVMLVSIYYGEVTEKPVRAVKEKRAKKLKAVRSERNNNNLKKEAGGIVR